jgi:hypothetical protein
MRLQAALFLLILFSCKSLSVLKPKITCKSDYNCEVNYYDETELVEKNDGLNQLYLSHKKNSTYKLVSVKVQASKKTIKAEDVLSITYYFNYEKTIKTAVKSLKAYRKTSCRCPNAGLVELTNIKAKITYNQKHPYLHVFGDELDLFEESLLLKL